MQQAAHLLLCTAKAWRCGSLLHSKQHTCCSVQLERGAMARFYAASSILAALHSQSVALWLASTQQAHLLLCTAKAWRRGSLPCSKQHTCCSAQPKRGAVARFYAASTLAALYSQSVASWLASMQQAAYLLLCTARAWRHALAPAGSSNGAATNFKVQYRVEHPGASLYSLSVMQCACCLLEAPAWLQQTSNCKIGSQGKQGLVHTKQTQVTCPTQPPTHLAPICK